MPDRPQPRTSPPRGFIRDFAWRDGRIVLRKTGNSAAIDRRLLAEVATWVGFYLVVRLIAALRHRGTARPAIWFTPDVPHPRYMLRIAAIWAGIGIARTADDASAAFFFEDATRSTPPPSSHARRINFGCGDISKSRVASVFAEVFGYPLAIDPARWLGAAVEKSEANGTHDGRVVACPREPVPGRAYQRLIDNIRADGFAYDLRTHVVDGTVIAVWVKRRAAAARFLPPNVSAERVEPASVFSAGELDRIGALARAMGADWCGMDVLRDEPSGRLYVVDVNKTDAGPIIALSLAEKLRSTAVLAKALRELVTRTAQPSAATESASASTRASRAA